MVKGSDEHRDKYILWFFELGKEDTPLVGGKGANLGEMYNLKLPVPPGFCITTKGYKHFLSVTGLGDKIYSILSGLDLEDTKTLDEKAAEIRKMIVQAEMPKDIQDELIESYESLNVDRSWEKASGDALSILKRGREPEFVAVRSSATAEDSGEASFAGQQETFLNTKGKTQVIEAVKKCWASLFTSRSIYYRLKKGFEHDKIFISVVIQMMVNSDKSGVIFSRDPVENPENIVIESVFGLGEGIVSGQIQPDHYIVSRDLKIIDKKISNKKIAITRDSGGNTETVKLTEDKSRSQVLNESEIKRYASYALQLEEHYGKPQDIEFAIDSGKLFIVQTRPITTLDMNRDKKNKEIKGEAVLSGQAASPGIGSGVVKIVHELSDLEKVKKGDIMVTKMTNPDMVVAMQKAAGIITDEGGTTSHAAIVSREMGIPCVVGTDHATKTLKDGQEVTVDGFNGKIYLGKGENVAAEIKPIEKTQTKIKVIVDLPDFAPRAAKTGAKQVGLTRIEGIIAESGKHPNYFLKNGKIKDYEKVIFSGVSAIAEHFEEVWVRTSDIRSDEFRNLEGSSKEPEVNPMLGMHGIRYSLKHPEILKAELLALKKVSEKGKKIGVMMPQVISVSELTDVKKMLKEIEFTEAKVGVMIETPAAVQIIRELCEEGIDFISFGTNDLTQYTLAIDRGEEELQPLYNEMHPAVLRQLASVIKVCHEFSVESSICGQAASNPEMASYLVGLGIDSLSVNADKAYEISLRVKELEDKGLRGLEADREVMVGKQIAEVDDLNHVRELCEEEAEEVKETNEKKIEEGKKIEEKIKVEEMTEEYPSVEFGFNVFKEQNQDSAPPILDKSYAGDSDVKEEEDTPKTEEVKDEKKEEAEIEQEAKQAVQETEEETSEDEELDIF